MEKSSSYDSCSKENSCDSDVENRIVDFNNEQQNLNNHIRKNFCFEEYRGGDAAAEFARFYPDRIWPNINSLRDFGPRFFANKHFDGVQDHAHHNGPSKKLRPLQFPQCRAVHQFDQAPKTSRLEATQHGIRLGTSWTYWHIASEGGTEEDWKVGMKPICTFDFKEQFWGMWNSIKSPSELDSKRELALFRGGLGRRPVWPDWNDSENVNGGRWKIIFRVTELSQVVDHFWRDFMLHCIEERWAPFSGFVNGISIKVKGQRGGQGTLPLESNGKEKCCRIYVWLSSSKSLHVEFIRKRAMDLLKKIPFVQMDFVTTKGDGTSIPSLRGPFKASPVR